MPSFRYLGFGWDGRQMAEYAFVNPGSGFGMAASVILSSQAIFGDDETRLASAGAAAARYVDTNGERPGMTQTIVPGCFLVAINATSGGQPVVNVVGVRNSGGTALGAAQAVQTAWKIAQGPLVKRTSLYQLSSFRAMDISSADGAIAEVSDSSVGGLASAAISTNAASALIKWNGGTRSKSSRGRLYHGPLAETDINSDGRTLVTAAITGFQSAYNGFLTSLQGSGYPLVVVSRKLQQAYTVSSVQIEGVIATQRRRVR
jgi:hypothetical protein